MVTIGYRDLSKYMLSVDALQIVVALSLQTHETQVISTNIIV